MNATQARTPWIAMLLAGVLLVSSLLAACRVTPTRTVHPAREPVARPQSMGPEIRVRMLREVETATLDAASGLTIEPADAPGAAWTGPGPVSVTRSPDGFRLSISSTPVRAQRVRVIGQDGVVTLGVGADAVTLEGELTLVARSDVDAAAFDVVETLPVERYLPGVLAKELYHHFAPQAYEAQAIASRSYALHERARRRSIGSYFDVESTTMDQAYAGAATHPRAADAVRATRGRVLAWDGGTLRAYYSSTCGDRAASARDTWPISAGYEFNTAEPIQAHARVCACVKSPRHRWTLDRSARAARDRIRAWGAEAGHAVRKMDDLRSIDVSERNVTGRPSRFRVTDAKRQTFDLSAEELRIALNTAAQGHDPIKQETRVLSGDLHCTVVGDELRLRGRGFGHGVGLCQFGADGLARQGLSYRDILARYYPGARIEQSY